jgi:transcription antitermination factor NusG
MGRLGATAVSKSKLSHGTQNGGALSNLQHIAGQPANALPGQVQSALRWYAVQTMPRHEKKVIAELQQKQVQSYLPVFSDERKWTDRRVSVDTPLFPGYVFVKISQDQDTRVRVLRTLGVRNFVGTRGIGDPIPDAEIESVQAVLARGIPVSVSPFLNIGQRVRILDGSLEGVEGILTAVNGDNSLIISVELIQRSLAMRVTGFRVEAV